MLRASASRFKIGKMLLKSQKFCGESQIKTSFFMHKCVKSRPNRPECDHNFPAMRLFLRKGRLLSLPPSSHTLHLARHPLRPGTDSRGPDETAFRTWPPGAKLDAHALYLLGLVAPHVALPLAEGPRCLARERGVRAGLGTLLAPLRKRLAAPAHLADRPATDKSCAPDRCQPAQESRSAQRPGLRVVASGAAPALGSPAGRPWEACWSLVPEVSAQACPPRAAGSGTSALEGIAGQRRPALERLRNPDWCLAPERSPFLPAVSIAQVPYSRPAALRKHAALRSLHPSALPLSGAVQHSLPQCRAGVPLAWTATSLLPCSCMEDAGKHAAGAGASGSRPRARATRGATRGETLSGLQKGYIWGQIEDRDGLPIGVKPSISTDCARISRR